MHEEWTLRAFALVAVGGALGSALRYAANLSLHHVDYAWGTLAVNVLGSFLIAAIVFGPVASGRIDPATRLFLATGILGGFTTMSGFALEVAAYVDNGQLARAFGWSALMVGGSLAAVFAGRAVVA